MAGQIPVAFAAGVVSFVAPCVLPLVPGYLSAVSAVEAGRLGEPGTTRRVFLGSLPFVAGFTVLFVALGAGAGLVGNAVSLNSTRVQAVAGFVVIVFGLAFAGLLPFPERLVAPGLVGGARRRGSGALLGAAFAVCAAPCMGPVLGAILGRLDHDGCAGLGLVARILARPCAALRPCRDRVLPCDGAVSLAP
jgi:cytochrome c-type biogenesis protein